MSVHAHKDGCSFVVAWHPSISKWIRKAYTEGADLVLSLSQNNERRGIEWDVNVSSMSYEFVPSGPWELAFHLSTKVVANRG